MYGSLRGLINPKDTYNMADFVSKVPGSPSRGYSSVQALAAAAAAPAVQINPNNNTVAGGVNYGGIGAPNLGSIEPIVIIHTAGTANEVIKIGDPYSLVATKGGFSPESDYSGSGSTWQPAALANLTIGGLVIRGLNYEVSNATQFTASLQYCSINAGGAYSANPLNGRLTYAKRSTDQNLLIKTLDMSNGQPLLLNEYNAIFLTVIATYTVTITLDVVANGRA